MQRALENCQPKEPSVGGQPTRRRKTRRLFSPALDQSKPVESPPITFGKFRLRSLRELMTAKNQDIKFIIPNVLAERQSCVIGGKMKCLKTSTAIDLAVSLVSGDEVPKQV